MLVRVGLQFAVLGLVCALSARAEEGDLSTPVAVLTDDNFGEALEDSHKRLWMIEFYAPWCGHCKALAPKYEEAATKVTSMRFGKVDATANKKYAGAYKVTGYPSLFWVRDGRHRRYKGAHTVEGFEQLYAKLAGPAVQSYSGDAEFRAFGGKADVVFALADAGGAACSDEQRLAFEGAARELQDELEFGRLEDVPDALGAGAAACAVARIEAGAGGGEGEPAQLLPIAVLGEGAAGTLDAERARIVAFCEQQKFPRVSALTSKTFWAASHADRVLVAAIVDDAAGAAAVGFRREFRRLSRPSATNTGAPIGLADPSSKFLFGIMDGQEKSEDTGKSLIGDFLAGYGVDVTNDLPTVVAFALAERNAEHYYAEGVSEPGDVQAFLNGVLDGSVHPQYQGIWGKPERIWRAVKAAAPFLEPLDALPPFSFVVPTGLLLMFGLLRLLCFGDDDEYEEEGEEQVGQKKTQ